MDTTPNQPDSGMARCIAACNECNRVCLQQIDHCLSLGGAALRARAHLDAADLRQRVPDDAAN